MTELGEKSPAVRLSRIFRKAGVFLAKGQLTDALVVLREGETLALTFGDTEKLTLFREEIARCQQQLNDYVS